MASANLHTFVASVIGGFTAVTIGAAVAQFTDIPRDVSTIAPHIAPHIAASAEGSVEHTSERAELPTLPWLRPCEQEREQERELPVTQQPAIPGIPALPAYLVQPAGPAAGDTPTRAGQHDVAVHTAPTSASQVVGVVYGATCATIGLDEREVPGEGEAAAATREALANAARTQRVQDATGTMWYPLAGTSLWVANHDICI